MPTTSRSGPAREPEPAAEAGAQRKRFGLPRSSRLTRLGDFRRVYGRGKRTHGQLLVVVALRRRSPGHRLGVAVSKEHGRAVRRNKLKRILREAFRLERPNLSGAFDLVLIPRKRDGRLALDDVRRELVDLVQRLCRDPDPQPRGRRGRRRQ